MQNQRFNRSRFHGVLSLSLIGLATVLALPTLFAHSITLGLGYIAISGVAVGVVITAYCAKCPCKGHCGHVLPGKLAQRVPRKPGLYTRAEYAALGIALAALIGVPQPWLWAEPGLFAAYWVLTGIALVEIRATVCRACGNAFCPLNTRAQPRTG